MCHFVFCGDHALKRPNAIWQALSFRGCLSKQIQQRKKDLERNGCCDGENVHLVWYVCETHVNKFTSVLVLL